MNARLIGITAIVCAGGLLAHHPAGAQSAIPSAVAGAPEWVVDDREFPFFGVVSAVLGPGDRLIVANRRTNEIAVFEREELRTVLGGNGGGPGEFQGLGRLSKTRDGLIAATDRVSGHVKVFHPLDGFVRDVMVRDDLRLSDAFPLSGNRWVTASFAGGQSIAALNQRVRAPGRVVVRDSLGELVLVVGEIQGPEGVMLGELEGPGFSMIVPPFAIFPLVGVDQRSGTVVIARPEEATVQFVPTDVGGQARTIRVPRIDQRLSVRDWARALDDLVAPIEDAAYRREMRDRLARLSKPSVVPAFSGMIVDSDGRVWLERYHHPGHDAHGWWVITASDEVAWVAAPPGTSRLLAVDGSRVALLRQSDLGVETVAVHRLQTGGDGMF